MHLVGIAGIPWAEDSARLMGKLGAGCDNLVSAELKGLAAGCPSEHGGKRGSVWAIREVGEFRNRTSLEYRLHRGADTGWYLDVPNLGYP